MITKFMLTPVTEDLHHSAKSIICTIPYTVLQHQEVLINKEKLIKQLFNGHFCKNKLEKSLSVDEIAISAVQHPFHLTFYHCTNTRTICFENFRWRNWVFSQTFSWHSKHSWGACLTDLLPQFTCNCLVHDLQKLKGTKCFYMPVK